MLEGVVIFSVMTIVSVVVLGISVLSFWKFRSLRMLLVCVMVGLFFVQSVLLSLGLFVSVVAGFTSSVFVWVFDVVILCLLYLVAVKP